MKFGFIQFGVVEFLVSSPVSVSRLGIFPSNRAETLFLSFRKQKKSGFVLL